MPLLEINHKIFIRNYNNRYMYNRYMYNTNFLPQIDKFRGHLFGPGVYDTRKTSDRANISYCLPSNISLIPCVEDTNGEWVPATRLETSINSE